MCVNCFGGGEVSGEGQDRIELGRETLRYTRSYVKVVVPLGHILEPDLIGWCGSYRAPHS